LKDQGENGANPAPYLARTKWQRANLLIQPEPENYVYNPHRATRGLLCPAICGSESLPLGSDSEWVEPTRPNR
jgi:hypothetical protein